MAAQSIKRKNEFLNNLKTDEELIRDVITTEMDSAEALETSKWMSSEEIIAKAASNNNRTSYKVYTLVRATDGQYNGSEIAYEDSSEEGSGQAQAA